MKTVDNKTKSIVDWSGRCETPAGGVGQMRPRRRPCAEEAQRPPRGKRAPGAQINLYQLCLIEQQCLQKHLKNMKLLPYSCVIIDNNHKRLYNHITTITLQFGVFTLGLRS